MGNTGVHQCTLVNIVHIGKHDLYIPLICRFVCPYRNLERNSHLTFARRHQLLRVLFSLIYPNTDCDNYVQDQALKMRENIL